MAKQGKVLPARRPRQDESLLLRSAESLGRMIGSLQRQLDDASRKLAPGNAHDNGDHNNRAIAAASDTRHLASAAARRAGNGSSQRAKSKASKRTAKSAASRHSSSSSRPSPNRRARKGARRT